MLGLLNVKPTPSNNTIIQLFGFEWNSGIDLTCSTNWKKIIYFDDNLMGLGIPVLS